MKRCGDCKFFKPDGHLKLPFSGMCTKELTEVPFWVYTSLYKLSGIPVRLVYKDNGATCKTWESELDEITEYK